MGIRDLIRTTGSSSGTLSGQSYPILAVTAPETVGEQVQTAKTPKCTFSGVVSIDLKRFLDSGIALVACPDCARTRTLSPRNRVLRFPSHDKRKTRFPNTGQQWAMEKTTWDVVGGERK